MATSCNREKSSKAVFETEHPEAAISKDPPTELDISSYALNDTFLSIYPATPQLAANIGRSAYGVKPTILQDELQHSLPDDPLLANLYLFNHWENEDSAAYHSLYERRSNQFYIYGNSRFTAYFESLYYQQNKSDYEVLSVSISLYRGKAPRSIPSAWTANHLNKATFLTKHQLVTYPNSGVIELKWNDSNSIQYTGKITQNDTIEISTLVYDFVDTVTQHKVRFELNGEIRKSPKQSIFYRQYGEDIYLLSLSYHPVDSTLQTIPQL
ncbi:hypothetical protein [Rubritalea sp.]|uniref:hypothetical protein n=1 Tax=Rubritalea sp. TaxID=2109375 RepID=UPI003EF2100A